MDYVVLPKDHGYQRQRIALMGGPYDLDEDFLTYPSRAGDAWQHVLPEKGKAPFAWYEHNAPSDDGALQSFFQTWLFFGLLEELFVRHELYRDSDYLGEDSDGTYVHMKHFGETLQQWTTAVSALHMNGKLELKVRLISCLALAHTSLYALHRLPGSEAGGHPDFDKPLRDSITTLCATISAAGQQCLDDVLPALDWPNFVMFVGFTQSEQDYMRQNGWCPSIIAQENGSFTSATYRHFIKNMSIPNVGFNHNACDDAHCKFESIDPKTFVIQHTSESCGCEAMGVSGLDVEKCLEDGTFPVMDICGRDLHEMTIEIVPYQDGVQYVALSHVWADGLGNPFANALPRCQLRRLQALLHTLAANPASWSDKEDTSRADKLYLWCDTLLVPVPERPHPTTELSPEERQHFEQQPSVAKSSHLWELAMTLMRDVYAKATTVLVLERTLEAIPVEQVGWMEAYIRLFSSRYTRRLWTYQEVALPSKVLIQYKDQTLNLSDLRVKTTELYTTNPLLRDLVSTIAMRHIGLRALRGLNHLDGPDLSMVYLSVRERKCSKIEDESLCVSTILGLDQKDIVVAKTHEDRMRAFWYNAVHHGHGVPQNIVFNQFPRLLSSRGYHWAPSTFQQDLKEIHRMHWDYRGQRAGLIQEVGLKVRYPGYRIRSGTGSPCTMTAVHNLLLRGISQGLLHMKFPSGDWCTLVPRPGRFSEENATPYGLLQADPNLKWSILQNNDGYGDSAGSPPALLGVMVSEESGQEVFSSRMLLTLNRLDSSWNTAMKAAEQHAQTLQHDPDLGKLYRVTSIERMLRRPLQQPMPVFLQRIFASVIATVIRPWLNHYGSRFIKALQNAAEPDAQTPEVRHALAAISAPQGHEFNMSALIAINFVGHGATITEEFDGDHEWVVG